MKPETEIVVSFQELASPRLLGALNRVDPKLKELEEMVLEKKGGHLCLDFFCPDFVDKSKDPQGHPSKSSITHNKISISFSNASISTTENTGIPIRQALER